MSEGEFIRTVASRPDADEPLPLDMEATRNWSGLVPEVPFEVSLLALTSLKGVGIRALRALVSSLGDELGVLWQLDRSDVAALLARHRVAGAVDLAHEILGQAEQLIHAGQLEEKELASVDVHVLRPSRLPGQLRHIPNGPLWLFVEGKPAALYAGPHFAVVGTRRPSQAGLRATEAVVRTMAAYSPVLVSGLAEGIDAAAHCAALRDGVPNVAFLGHGTSLVFPKETATLRRKITESGGCVASEYPPSEHYRKQNFVERNRLQAGLSDVVVAVEGQATGGTAHTVRFAAKFGRRLLGTSWPGAGSLSQLVADQDDAVMIEIFSSNGRRKLDTLLRSVAEHYHERTNALDLVARQLERESQLRATRPQDWRELRALIDALESGGSADGR